MVRKSSKKENKSVKFSVKISQPVAEAVIIFCETIEIDPKEFIRDAIVEKLLRTHVELKSEDYIYLGDRIPEVKKPLKTFFEGVRLMLEHNSK